MQIELKLLAEWRLVASKAWSFRLSILAGALSSVTVIMGVAITCGASLGYKLAFMAVSVAASVAGFAAAAARVTAQPKSMP